MPCRCYCHAALPSVVKKKLATVRHAAEGYGAFFPWRVEYDTKNDRAKLVNSLDEVVGDIADVRHAECVAKLTEMV